MPPESPGEPIEEKKDQKPRARAAGGVWIQSSDFPCAFQHLIVYHNMSSYEHTEMHQDIWSEPQQPYIANEKDVYLKLSVDEELLKKYKEDNKLDAEMTLQEIMHKSDAQLAKESWDDENCLPGERKKQQANPNQVMVAFSPYPTAKPYDVLPRYFARI